MSPFRKRLEDVKKELHKESERVRELAERYEVGELSLEEYFAERLELEREYERMAETSLRRILIDRSSSSNRD